MSNRGPRILNLEDYIGEAVVSVSDFNESIEPAIKSILRNHEYFSALHIVKYGYSKKEVMYPGWLIDLIELRDKNLEPIWHSNLDATKLKTFVAIHVSPDHQIKDGAMDMLYTDMAINNTQSLFAVTGITCLEEKSFTIAKCASALSYGFLLVVMIIDAYRTIFNLTRYHTTNALRAQTVTKTFPQRAWLTERRWWLWFFYTRVSGTSFGGSGLGQIPVEKDRGLTFVLRHIKTHQHLGIGIWIIGFILYYFFFAYPWWSVFFKSFGYTNMPQVNNVIDWIKWIFVRNPYSTVSLISQCINGIVISIVATVYFIFPYRMQALLCLFFPVYLTICPIVLLVGRFYVSRASWNNLMEVEEEKEKEEEKGKEEEEKGKGK